VERLRGKVSFKTELDDEARRHMFPHQSRPASAQPAR
jgi:hypothetical protein